jgi:hypothetical protein
MLLLAAVVAVLVVAVLASAGAWAIGAHLNADSRVFSSAAAAAGVRHGAGASGSAMSRSRIVLSAPLD